MPTPIKKSAIVIKNTFVIENAIKIVAIGIKESQQIAFVALNDLHRHTQRSFQNFGGVIGAVAVVIGVNRDAAGGGNIIHKQHARILRKFHRAWGLETAIWDLIGKACGQPLYKLWGGYTDRIRGYASTIEVGTPEERAQDTLGFIEEGFRAIKLRLHNDTLAEDIALAKAVADAANGRMDLMADGNQAQTPVTPSSQSGVIWDLKRARYTARALEEMGFVWLEEPLSRYDYDGLASLNTSVDLAIAGGENNAYFHEYRTLLERNCYDILQPDALVSEGIGQLRKIAALAEVRTKLGLPDPRAQAAAASAIRGRVSLDPGARAKVQPDDTVFIYATAPDSRMPLAIVRIKASELPFEFVLDDTKAMNPQVRLSDSPTLVMRARVSRSGQAQAQPDDLSAEMTGVKPGTKGLHLILK